MLLVDHDEEVWGVADVSEMAIDLHIDFFHFVLGIVEMHGGADVVEVALVLETIIQNHADGTGAASDACAATQFLVYQETVFVECLVHFDP